jgi:hypothetical protein
MDWCLKHPKTTLAGALGIFVGVMMMAKLFLGFSLSQLPKNRCF